MVVPLSYFPRLLSAQPAQREQWLLIGRGLGVRWEALDEDLSVENILLAYSRSKAGEYARASHSQMRLSFLLLAYRLNLFRVPLRYSAHK